MPTYEYACKGCGHEFEREQRISEAPIKKCPSCGAMKARRQISRTSFVLKGGGWYSDLYGAPKAEKPEASAGDDKAAAKADAKPATDSTPAETKGDSKPAETKSDSKPTPPKKGGGKGKKAAA
jgi:putative FmdB family regulatory protein